MKQLFKEIFISKLTEDYQSNPSAYVKSLERTIETELEALTECRFVKDNPVLIATCELYGIKCSYGALKEVCCAD